MAVSARRLRAAAHREHHGRIAGRLHRPSSHRRFATPCTAIAPRSCASRSRKTSASRQLANCGCHNPSQSVRVNRPSCSADAISTVPTPQSRSRCKSLRSAHAAASDHFQARMRRRQLGAQVLSPCAARYTYFRQVQHDQPADAKCDNLFRDFLRVRSSPGIRVAKGRASFEIEREDDPVAEVAGALPQEPPAPPSPSRRLSVRRPRRPDDVRALPLQLQRRSTGESRRSSSRHRWGRREYHHY